MNFNAARFINNRINQTSITNHRIQSILWYFVECNKLQIRDKVIYSISWVKEQTTLSFEDYLKFEFVDNYLSRNKSLLKDKLSELEGINFSCETQKRYWDTSDHKQKVDKIDIFISRLGLQKEWNEVDENIYFAVECKRIKDLGDIRLYIRDIEKFTTRNHTNLRIPYEGQLAFIENGEIEINILVNKINSNLADHSVVRTEKFLTSTNINKSDTVYNSAHRKGFDKNDFFEIFHMFFNYSKIVVE